MTKPSPSSPTRLDAGTRTSSKASSPVLPAWIPSFPWIVAVVKPGRILYEMGGMGEQLAHEALKLAQAKLPVLTRIVHRADLSL